MRPQGEQAKPANQSPGEDRSLLMLMCRTMSSARLTLLIIALHLSHPISADVSFSAAESPAETLSRYFLVLDQRIRNPDLDLYTPATRRMLSNWQTSEAQMANLVSTFERCRAEEARVDSGRRFAVIRYPIAQRQCSPWFFEFIDGAWALDLTMMQRAIRFGRNSAWRFDQDADHPYAFAFEDWTFDSQGFPVSNN